MDITFLRKTVVALLDDEHGICLKGYETLQTFVQINAPNSCNDIFNAAESADGRCFLPETHEF